MMLFLRILMISLLLTGCTKISAPDYAEEYCLEVTTLSEGDDYSIITSPDDQKYCIIKFKKETITLSYSQTIGVFRVLKQIRLNELKEKKKY